MDKHEREECERLHRLADRWGRDLAYKRGIEHKKADPAAEKLSTGGPISATTYGSSSTRSTFTAKPASISRYWRRICPRCKEKGDILLEIW